ncbi:MAG: acyl--CoA ligase [Thermomicrobiales bacterium]
MATVTTAMTLLDLLAGAGDHPALIAPEKLALTYAQMRANVVALAAQLNGMGLGQGDRIAIAMGNGPEMVLAYCGATLCGTAAPLNPNYKQDEFAFYFEDTQAKALITLPDTLPAAHAAASGGMTIIEALPQPDGTLAFNAVKNVRPARPEALAGPDDIAMILHTSGTTSRPKRVPIHHRNLAASAHNIATTYALSETDRSLCVMPLFHIHALVASMLATLASGGTVICPVGGFNALEFWKIVDAFKPTWYSAVPTMHQTLLARADRNMEIITANPFRFIRSGSSSLAPIVMERMEAAFGAPVLENYGMTEATHQMTSNPLPPKAHKAGTVGYGFGVDVAIMDDDGNLLPQGGLGEVVVKGPNVIDGYENNPEANATAFVNGWFRTGDQGQIDADGYLSLTGRLKELINRGGEKISPLEIDDVLLRHAAVAEAVAFAVPHATLGEEVHAAVVLKGEATERELRAYCAERLAEFKVPRRFHMLEAIPRGATGKLQRINMAKLLDLTSDQ